MDQHGSTQPTQHNDEGVGGRFGRRLWLASRSPRRRQLLTEYGYDYELAETGVDDSTLRPGSAPPHAWVMALAFLKASSARAALGEAGLGKPVLGADTVCVIDGRIVGQPRDQDDARSILIRFSNAEHEVLTGVAIVCPGTGRRELFYERSVVRMGDLTDLIEAYLDSGSWRGKAGAYNLAERLAEGWPIEYDGDPTSIMGLPMDQLGGRLEAFCERGRAG